MKVSCRKMYNIHVYLKLCNVNKRVIQESIRCIDMYIYIRIKFVVILAKIALKKNYCSINPTQYTRNTDSRICIWVYMCTCMYMDVYVHVFMHIYLYLHVHLHA